MNNICVSPPNKKINRTRKAGSVVLINEGFLIIISLTKQHTTGKIAPGELDR